MPTDPRGSTATGTVPAHTVPAHTGRAHTGRAHTGRRRNEQARLAILDAAADLLARDGITGVSVDDIAAAAGVGKQTIYRWWPSKSAVLAEAMARSAQLAVRDPDTGALREDLREFLASTFERAGDPATANVLRGAVSEAQRDETAGEIIRQFTEDRRAALRAVLQRGADRGELAPDADLELILDQAFGVLWYRLLITRTALDPASARALADNLVPDRVCAAVAGGDLDGAIQAEALE